MAGSGVFEVAGFTFSSNFDSGNLAHVQLSSSGTSGLETSESETEAGLSSPSRSAAARPSTSTAQLRSAGIETPDYAFQLWTRPDCQHTKFENANRTWFFFGLKGGPAGAILKFTVMNLNKQNKLFSQGMAPVFKIQGKANWERIRDLPTYSTQENNFTMSFKFRNIEEPNCQIFFAFTYPYTYKELQTDLGKFEKKHSNAHLSWPELQSLPSTSIYFNRELVIQSLEGRRLDLITISGMNNIMKAKEPTLSNLFPDQDGSRRPHKFSNKKTVFLSARVHPGETCSSFVIHGIIKFILNSSDARAAALRSKYVFKLVPMLNPDGVFRGHYRTDTRGVNLNRVYMDPSPSLHPTIYAAKKLVLLAHLGVAPAEETVSVNALIRPSDGIIKRDGEGPELSDAPDDSGSGVNLPTYRVSESDEAQDLYKPLGLWDIGKGSGSRGRSSTSSRVSNSSRTSHCSGVSGSQAPGPAHSTPVKGESSLQWYEMTETSRCSEGDESVADFSVGPSFGIGSLFGAGETNKCDNADAFLPPEIPSSSSPSKKSRFGRTSFAGMFEKGTEGIVKGAVDSNCNLSPELGPGCVTTVTGTVAPPTGESGLFLYVDIHGHASKRGIFMYGNHFEELETKVSALLYPKIMSINSANFDFPACNFTAKNMYMKDRHTGAGKEGSGRVSIFKATGLIYCYTLECNFNTGRFTNSVPLSSRDSGRASPPPIYDHPPKYCPDIYEQCGRYLAISILDLTESNPWTRLPCSSCKTLKGVRNTIKQWLKAAETEAAAKTAKNAAKGSPMRTRLRSVSTSKKKSPVKQIHLLKSPSSPELALSGASHQLRPLSKQTRKAISPKHSQSVPSKVGRQNSRSASTKSAEPTKKKRIGSGKKLKGSKLSGGGGSVAKTGGGTKGGSKPGSRSGSRTSSPKRNKTESKGTKSKTSQKKGLKKAAWKSLEDPHSSDNVVITNKKLKRKKKKVSNMSV